MTESVGHQAADGVKLIPAEVSLKRLVEILNGRQSLDGEGAVGVLVNKAFFFKIKLVFNIANNLLKHIFNGDDAADAAILVINNRKMIPRAAKFLQQHVKPFALGDPNGRPQIVTQVAYAAE